MKRLLTLPSWLLFLLTSGLPVLTFIVIFAVTLLFIEMIQGDAVFMTPFQIGVVIVASWTLGLILLQIWALTATYFISKNVSGRSVMKWGALIGGTTGLIVLGIVSYSIFFEVMHEAVEASTSQVGFNSIAPIRTPWEKALYYAAISGIWFVPRLLFFGLLARLLTIQEQKTRWFSTFLLFVLWPIGVWFLQPRLRLLVRGRKELLVEEHLV